jgi:hypothetical protein
MPQAEHLPLISDVIYESQSDNLTSEQNIALLQDRIRERDSIITGLREWPQTPLNKHLTRRAFAKGVIAGIAAFAAIYKLGSEEEHRSTNDTTDTMPIPTLTSSEETALPKNPYDSTEGKIEELDVEYRLDNWNVLLNIADLKNHLYEHPDIETMHISLRHLFIDNYGQPQEVTLPKRGYSHLFTEEPVLSVSRTDEKMHEAVEDAYIDNKWFFKIPTAHVDRTQVVVDLIGNDKEQRTYSTIATEIPLTSEHEFTQEINPNHKNSFAIHTESPLNQDTLSDIYDLAYSFSHLGVDIRRIIIPDKSTKISLSVEDTPEVGILVTPAEYFDNTDPRPENQHGLIILSALAIDALTDPEKNKSTYYAVQTKLLKLQHIFASTAIPANFIAYRSILNNHPFEKGIPDLTPFDDNIYNARDYVRQIIPLIKYQPEYIKELIMAMSNQSKALALPFIETSLSVIATATDEEGYHQFFSSPQTQELLQLIKSTQNELTFPDSSGIIPFT